MRCEHCGRNEATFHYKSAVNGQVAEVHLCADCAAELGRGFGDLFGNSFGGVFSLLPDLQGGFERIDGAQLTPTARRTLQLARTFGEPAWETEPLLDGDEERALRRERERNALNVRLHEAVEAEDYEQAAQLRDELKKLDNN